MPRCSPSGRTLPPDLIIARETAGVWLDETGRRSGGRAKERCRARGPTRTVVEVTNLVPQCGEEDAGGVAIDEQRGTLGTVRNAALLLELLSEGPAYHQLT